MGESELRATLVSFISIHTYNTSLTNGLEGCCRYLCTLVIEYPWRLYGAFNEVIRKLVQIPGGELECL